jgi:hypothetical protein
MVLGRAARAMEAAMICTDCCEMGIDICPGLCHGVNTAFAVLGDFMYEYIEEAQTWEVEIVDLLLDGSIKIYCPEWKWFAFVSMKDLKRTKPLN